MNFGNAKVGVGVAVKVMVGVSVSVGVNVAVGVNVVVGVSVGVAVDVAVCDGIGVSVGSGWVLVSSETVGTGVGVNFAARGTQAVIIHIIRIIVSIEKVRSLFIPIFTSVSIVDYF